MNITLTGLHRIFVTCLLVGMAPVVWSAGPDSLQNKDRERVQITLENAYYRQKELRVVLHTILKQNAIKLICEQAHACPKDEKTFSDSTYRLWVQNAVTQELRQTLLRIYALQKVLWRPDQAGSQLATAEEVSNLVTRSFAALRGKLPWPIEGEMHPLRNGQGLLLPASPGTLVRAIHPGRVVFADQLRGYGKLIIVEHEDGFMTLYGQNQDLRKKLGDSVMRGETIAEVGKSEVLKTGLYFEIREQGAPVDPTHFCQKESFEP